MTPGRGSCWMDPVTVHIVVRQEMPADAERTFDLIHDYSRRLCLGHPAAAAPTSRAGDSAERGAVAVCTARRMLGGYSFRTRYVSFTRPKVAAIKLEGRPPFFASWAASIRHEPAAVDHQRTGRSRRTP